MAELTTTLPLERRRVPRRARTSGARTWFRAYTALAVAVVAGIAVLGEGAAGGIALSGMLGVTAPIVTLAGARLNRPRSRRPWELLAISSAMAVVATVIRGGGDQLAVSSWSHLPALASYGLIALAFTSMLRARRGAGYHGARLDATLVATALGLLAWTFFAVPTMSERHSSLITTAALAVYPVASSVIVFLAMQLAFTKVTDAPAFRLLAGGLGLVLVADIGYAASAAGYIPAAPAAFDLIYVLAAVSGAAAALHPSMVELTEPMPAEMKDLSTTRVALLALALGSPVIVVAAQSSVTATERIPAALAGVVIIVLVIRRVVDAANRYAASERKLRHDATHDSLTGLANRSWLLESLPATLTRKDIGGVAVLFCDLDRFKYVNDTWGHDIGDKLLITVSERLDHVAARLGGNVARIGGDEYVVVLPKVTSDGEAVASAKAVLSVFSEPFELGVGTYHMAPSVGICRVDCPSNTTPNEMLRRADTAMYVAKSSGSGVALFDNTMPAKVARRLELENELRGVAGRGELVLHYQPVVSLDTGELDGFEALVRWNHPQRGLLGPDEFINICEETGMICDVGDWVVTEAVSTLTAWWRRDPDSCPTVAVNVSGRQLVVGGFAERVASLLENSGLPAHRLHVEITETAVLEGASDVVARQLDVLAVLGVTIAADDFGTGYSSLAYLHRYPVDVVKIDRGFVETLTGGADSVAGDDTIVSAVVAMAGALGLDIVAEGVETVHQRDRLAELGCRWAQGWLYSKPVGRSEADDMVLRRRSFAAVNA